jgi:hypothetical protein
LQKKAAAAAAAAAAATLRHGATVELFRLWQNIP